MKSKNLLILFLISVIVLLFLYRQKPPVEQEPLPEVADEFPRPETAVGNYRNKGLNSFPKPVLNNASITRLDLSENNIESLPSEIGKLTNLKEFYIEKSSLRSLPGEIRHFTDLLILDASDNNLTGIPAEIGQLPKIERIDFSNNQITDLPNEIFNLTHLNELDLTGNPLDPARVSELRNSLSGTEVKF